MGLMVLQAISAGPCVPLDYFDAQVHSVFASAANLRIGNTLITLLAANQPNQPRGIRIATPEDFSFDHWLHPAETAACRAGVIRFSNAPFQLDLRGAQPWRRDLKSFEAGLPSMDGWRAALTALTQHPAAALGIAGAAFDLGDAPSPLAEAATNQIRALLDAAHQLDITRSVDAASHLIGLGPGLTPSGDDFLAGFTAGLWIGAARDPRCAVFMTGFCSALVQLAAHTTDISRGFLLDAARGQASEWIIDLAEAIAHDQDAVYPAMQIALMQGSTSGADTVAGLLAALRLWTARPQAAQVHIAEQSI